jgi:cell shape-determining protein MreD
VLVWAVYAYQYKGNARALWFLPAYGLVLEILELSYAPAPWLHWSFTALVVYALGQRVFTNRSFYSMAVIALAALFTLMLASLTLAGLFGIMRFQQVPWIDVALSQLWPAILAAALLLFVAPWVRSASRS